MRQCDRPYGSFQVSRAKQREYVFSLIKISHLHFMTFLHLSVNDCVAKYYNEQVVQDYAAANGFIIQKRKQGFFS